MQWDGELRAKRCGWTGEPSRVAIGCKETTQPRYTVDRRILRKAEAGHSAKQNCFQSDVVNELPLRDWHQRQVFSDALLTWLPTHFATC